MSTWILSIALACSPSGQDEGATRATDDTAPGGDTWTGDDTASTDDTAAPALHGSVPAEPVPLPEFVATNHDGTARGPADLTGHPTVMWFYPAAGTGG